MNTQNMNGRTAMLTAVKRGNICVVRGLYRMGERLDNPAMEYPGSGGKAMYEIAITNGHQRIAEWIDEQLHGQKDSNGGRMAKRLQALCKDVIRSTLALRGTNITQKIHMLEYPQALKEALMTADGPLELN